MLKVEITELIGKTIDQVFVDGNKSSILFLTRGTKRLNGQAFEMFHGQDCCETVWLEDVCGNWDDIVGQTVVNAYMSTSKQDPMGLDFSHTWTFYTITTTKGTVVLRWCGTSNG